jgi:hypothetical protein
MNWIPGINFVRFALVAVFHRGHFDTTDAEEITCEGFWSWRRRMRNINCTRFPWEPKTDLEK